MNALRVSSTRLIDVFKISGAECPDKVGKIFLEVQGERYK